MRHKQNHAQKPKIFLVSGTGTGVGKTMFCACLIAKLIKHMGIGAVDFTEKISYIKPLQTGIAEEFSDEHTIVDSIFLKKIDIHSDTFHSAKLPASPHLAFDLEKKKIDLKKVVARIKEVASKKPYTVLEGAGGLLVPLEVERDAEGNYLSKTYFFVDLLADLIKALKNQFDIHLCMVASAGLGTINHSLLSCNAIRSHLEFSKLIEHFQLSLHLNDFFASQQQAINQDNYKVLSGILKAMKVEVYRLSRSKHIEKTAKLIVKKVEFAKKNDKIFLNPVESAVKKETTSQIIDQLASRLEFPIER